MSLRDISVILRNNQVNHGIVITYNSNDNTNSNNNNKITHFPGLPDEGVDIQLQHNQLLLHKNKVPVPEPIAMLLF
jgi:hypothetical protein